MERKTQAGFVYKKNGKSYDYHEEIVLPNKTVKKFKSTIHFLKKADVLERVKDNYFKLVDVIPLKDEDHELYIFKKQK